MKIRVWVETGTSTTHEDIVEIPDEEWAALTEQGQEDRLDEEAREFLGNNIDFGACVLNEEGAADEK